ncbi:MAG: LPS assembly lipoprotein LptE [Rhodospirillales bacterium]
MWSSSPLPSAEPPACPAFRHPGGGRAGRGFALPRRVRRPVGPLVTVLAAGLLAAGLLGGCGFHPLYKPLAEDASPTDRAVADQLASVHIATIPNRQGQELRNQLEDKLHLPGTEGTPGRYLLNVGLGEFQQSLAIRVTGLATRTNLYMSATYNLVDSTSGASVLTGSAVSIASYDLIDDDFSTLTAINDARTRTITRIADDIRNRLAVHFATAPAVAVATPQAAQPADTAAPPVQPPATFIPSPGTTPTIASPAGTPIELPPVQSGGSDSFGTSSAPIGPADTRTTSTGTLP